MNNINGKNRIAWVDAAKGIAMIFVLIIHYDRNASGRIAALGLMFCVQLFFFLSGMFAAVEKYSLKEYIIRQAKSLLLPYAVFSAVNLAFHLCFNPHLPLNEIKNIIIGIILARRNYMLVAAMWFLPCLFLVSVMYKLLTMAIKNRRLLLVLTFAAAAYAKVFMQEPILPFTANQALRFLFYFAAGREIYPYIKDWSIEKFKAQKPAVKALFVYHTIASGIVTWILFRKEYLFYWENDFIFYTSLFVHTVVIISFVIIVSVLISGFAPLSAIGRNTLGFCCLENINRTAVNTAMAVTGIGFLPDSPVKVVLFNFIAMAVGYIILIPVNRFCPFILGKRKSVK
ncbi:MAG: acyltransferase [Oscillospiraceae bacterium]|nr:acyltransferase [Oscillospiraceae bacterium]